MGIIGDYLRPYITAIVIVGVLAALSVSGYFVLNYRHLQTENKSLKETVKTQADTIEFFKQAAKIDVDTAAVQGEINEAINSGDPQRRLDLLRKLRRMSAPPAD